MCVCVVFVILIFKYLIIITLKTLWILLASRKFQQTLRLTLSVRIFFGEYVHTVIRSWPIITINEETFIQNFLLK